MLGLIILCIIGMLLIIDIITNIMVIIKLRKSASCLKQESDKEKQPK
jgi:hypothetical protein